MKKIFTLILLVFLSCYLFAQAPFITTWKTDNPGSSCNTCITIPTYPGETYNYDVDWNNDGIYDQFGITGDVTHDFGAAGTKTIRIIGTFPRIYFAAPNSDKLKILNVNQWGDIVWTSMESAFKLCYFDFTITAVDSPDLSNVTSLSEMFRGYDDMTGNFNNWDVSTITDMSYMFQGTWDFNSPLSNWDVSNVTNMSNMFNVSRFNQPIGNWDVSSVTDMSYMFCNYPDSYYPNTFNQPIDNWDVSNVTDMSYMFFGTMYFNQPLENWDVSSVTNMEYMFASAVSFNQPLDDWNVSNVTNMKHMFSGHEGVWVTLYNPFNQPIGNWNVGNVTDMSFMFWECPNFNQPIGNWNVSNVITMEGIFGSNSYSAFNHPIGNWDVSNVTNMAAMFTGSAFNQPIGNWDVSNVTDMHYMFFAAYTFDQPLGNWDVSNVTNMEWMFNLTSFNQNVGNWTLNSGVNLGALFNNSNIDCNNYSGTLIGWANNPLTPSGRILDSWSGITYGPNAVSARNYLINNKGWSISGDSYNSDCYPIPATCTSLTSPLNNSSDISINTNLTWALSPDATGYKLTIGTTSGGTDILNNQDVGNTTTYDPPVDFPCGATIYVRIVPYSGTGDATGCTEESFATEDVLANAGSDVEICQGSNTQLDASGGTTFSWSPVTGLSDPNIANPVASPNTTTIYTVTVSNNGRCPDTDQVTVTVNPLPVPNATAIAENCNNCNNGTATSNPTNGTPSYSYNWSNGGNTQTINNLSPGAYTVTVTDSKTCFASQSVNVAEFICPTLTINASQINATCYNMCNGSITITGVTNSVPPLSYTWSNGATTAMISNLCAGSYTVTVTDSKNCPVTQSFAITQPTQISPNATATAETGNNFNDGTASANPSGGTPGYTYLWSNGASTQTIANLSPGSHSVTVYDAVGCTATQTVVVSEFICPTMTINETIYHVSCNGLCDGTITINSVTNGVPPFLYSWSIGGNNSSVSDLCPGTYSVTITDSKNCQISESYTITQPDVLIVEAFSTDETAFNANDGTATAIPSGGTAAYTYSWSNGATTQTITGLTPGNYTVTVEDMNGCTDISMTIVDEFVCPDLNLNTAITDVSCYELCDGLATVTAVSNGVPPYMYLWSDGQTTQTAEELCSGTYTVTVTDSKNCSVISDLLTISEPEELSIMVFSTNESYYQGNDGTASVIASGGTAGYTYLWSNGATTSEIVDLAPGLYYVTVSDAVGCDKSAEVLIEPFICPSISLEVGQEGNQCFGDCNGFIEVSFVINGTPPYTYNWSNGGNTYLIEDLCAGNYSVTVTDYYGCSISEIFSIVDPPQLVVSISSTDESSYDGNNGTATAFAEGGTDFYSYLWSNGGTTQTITNLAPGSYTVTVTDQVNCMASETVFIEAFECPSMEINEIITDLNCFENCDGTVDIFEVTNAMYPLEYQWSNGQSGQAVSNLCAGDYSVTVIDARNCVVTEIFTVNQPELLIVNIISTDETANDANDGTATALPGGGTAPYTYLWSNGQASQTITGLEPGSYSVTITDQNGCLVVGLAVVAEFGCTGLVITTAQQNVSCNGVCDGIIEITGVQNGVPPFAYNWSNNGSTNEISDLCAGTYFVTITDANNCDIYGSYYISQPSVLQANATGTGETANGANDGFADVNPTGGTGPYTYEWSNGANTNSITDLSPGTYMVTVTDANECFIMDTIEIDPFICPELVFNVQIEQVSCFGLCDGQIQVIGISNAVEPVAYLWTTGSTSSFAGNLCAGTYALSVTDAKNCNLTGSFEVVQPDEMVIVVDSVRHFKDPYYRGFIEISTDNDNLYEFEWTGPNDFKAITQDIYDLEIGCYTLVLTDLITGCEIDTTVCIDDLTYSQSEKLLPYIELYPNPARNELILDFGKEDASKAEIFIFDNRGNIQISNIESRSAGQIRMNTVGLADGLYNIQIYTGFGIVYKRFVIVR